MNYNTAIIAVYNYVQLFHFFSFGNSSITTKQSLRHWTRVKMANEIIGKVGYRQTIKLMKGKAPQEAKPVWDKSSLGFIAAVHQW